LDPVTGCFAVDATVRTLHETGRSWGEPLAMTSDVEVHVAQRWGSYPL
ncbi:MAG: hypothetical protein HQL93_11175, partial [Magnetococcales bacterium]|nr:hypothetical protein [Magnetococcales bacterium]